MQRVINEVFRCNDKVVITFKETGTLCALCAFSKTLNCSSSVDFTSTYFAYFTEEMYENKQVVMFEIGDNIRFILFDKDNSTDEEIVEFFEDNFKTKVLWLRSNKENMEKLLLM